MFLPITLVKDASTIADDELWLKSIETSFSEVISKTLFDSFFEAIVNASLIFSIVTSFFVQKTNYIKENLGVSTLFLIPSSLPFKEGIISPIASDAPVDVGTID